MLKDILQKKESARSSYEHYASVEFHAKRKLMSMVLLILAMSYSVIAQDNFSDSPLNASFITTDYDNFWELFGNMDAMSGNPIEDYLNNASEGLKPLVGYLDPALFYQTVLSRKDDYLSSRSAIENIGEKKKKIQASYAALKYWYPEAVFPPIYFAVGMFNSAGTVSDNGLLIGSEMIENLDGLTGLVAHELIHFQQNISGENNLLGQSLVEGSADFIGELISGEHINMVTFRYGELHERTLCEEFVTVMLSDDYTDWLYGTSGKDQRPNDLGYWIGYKITEAYFNQQNDKKQAIKDIMNIKDPVRFAKESGYLDTFWIE